MTAANPKLASGGPPPPRLVLFPGIGVNGGVFQLQRPLRDLPIVLETPGWIEPRPPETVEAYALRMASLVRPRLPGERLFLGGLSFGGMVALEAARLLRPDGVFLISSGPSHRVIAPLVRPFLWSVGLATPRMLSLGLKSTGLLARLVGRPDRRQRRLLLDLVPRVNVRVCIWGGPAMLRWEFGGELNCPVWRIQGGIDWVVPPPGKAVGSGPGSRVDLLVPQAGHAVNVTHPAVVNHFIGQKMAVDGA